MRNESLVAIYHITEYSCTPFKIQTVPYCHFLLYSGFWLLAGPVFKAGALQMRLALAFLIYILIY